MSSPAIALPFTLCKQRHIHGGKNVRNFFSSACRAGTDSTYSHGEDPSLLDQYEVIRFYGTQRPGSKLPNCWGLFDVQGNVQEWCHDWYEPFGIEAAATDPFGPIYGQSRIQRGGSFRSSMSKVRPSVRSMVPPLNRGFDTGFRVVRTNSAGPEMAPAPQGPPQPQDAAVAEIKRLGGLVERGDITGEVTLVRFNHLRITDVGLEQVIELTSLTGLELINTQISDVGLRPLKGLVRLKKLWLGGTPITDAGLVHLKAMTSLTELGLSNTPITDAGLAHLKGKTSLTVLVLFDTQITDVGLEHLKELTSLENLWLYNTPVTDAGLVHLKGMTSLTKLGLGNTQITDAGLEHLKGMTSLRDLRLRETQITDAGLAELKVALPNCEIAGR